LIQAHSFRNKFVYMMVKIFLFYFMYRCFLETRIWYLCKFF